MGLVDLVNRAKELLEPEEGKCLWCNGNADTGHDPCCEAACWLADAAAPSAKVMRVRFVQRDDDWYWLLDSLGVRCIGHFFTRERALSDVRQVAEKLNMEIEVVE